MGKKAKKHHRIFNILLKKLVDDGAYDAEDLYILVELAQEWKLDIGQQCDQAGVAITVFDPPPGVKPVGPAPTMPTMPKTFVQKEVDGEQTNTK